VRELADDAVRAGAKQATQAMEPAGPGFWCHPIVLFDLPRGARILHEEPFGPVVPICPFDDLEDAVAEANRLPVGLAAFAFTRSAARMMMLTEQVDAGMVAANSFEISAPETPFGGIKDSGWGSEGGTEGLDAYLTTKAIHMSTLE
jgi:succinate-semialdehyde dehydrogenase / glutarate-semialdehyde dehydrogenase